MCDGSLNSVTHYYIFLLNAQYCKTHFLFKYRILIFLGLKFRVRNALVVA